MNALTAIEASIDEPTVAAVATAFCNQMRDIGYNRRIFNLASQIEAAKEVTRRLESVQIAAGIIYNADRAEDMEAYGEYVGSDDDRPTVWCWEEADTGCSYLQFVVIDPHAEQGAAVVVPRDSCLEAFGTGRVLAWELAEANRRADREAAAGVW